MQSFNNIDGGRIIPDLAAAILRNKQYLSDIDGAIGDGDHGINMNKGFSKAAEEFTKNSGNLSQGLHLLSQVLMVNIGGSMGPLYGYFFRSMARTCKEKEVIDVGVFGEMLQAALSGIRGISQAQPGDKTLLDTLAPAVKAFEDNSGKGFVAALEAMRQAACLGRDSTRDMIAKVGRSSRLGERSRGVIDAGAASCCLILETMADSVGELISSVKE